MKNKYFIPLLAALILALFLFVFCGCYTEKKALAQVDKAIIKYPVPSSQKFRMIFPCVKIGRSFYADSTAYKSSLDSLNNSKLFYEALIQSQAEEIEHDTAFDLICADYLKEIDRLKKITATQTKYIIDLTDDFNNVQPIVIRQTDTIADMSVIMEKDVELQAAKKETQVAKKETAEVEQLCDKLDKKIHRKNIQLWILYVIIGLQVLYFGAKLYLKKYTKILPV